MQIFCGLPDAGSEQKSSLRRRYALSTVPAGKAEIISACRFSACCACVVFLLYGR